MYSDRCKIPLYFAGEIATNAYCRYIYNSDRNNLSRCKKEIIKRNRYTCLCQFNNVNINTLQYITWVTTYWEYNDERMGNMNALRNLLPKLQEAAI